MQTDTQVNLEVTPTIEAATEAQFLVNLRAGARGLRRCEELPVGTITYDDSGAAHIITDDEHYAALYWSKMLYESGRLGLQFDCGYTYAQIAAIVAALDCEAVQ